MASKAESRTSAALFRPNVPVRKLKGYVFACLGILSIVLALGTLLTLLIDVARDGIPWLNWNFITSFDSRFAPRAGLRAALMGTLWLMALTILFALPLGVLSAIYLEEYAGDNWFTRFIQVNISNLAGVPSIVYGLLGLQIFVRLLNFNRSILAGALTMALLVLPIIIVAGRESIRAVPSSMRDASFALGATRSQTVRHHVLPYAFPGILTGNILAASRAIGETAPLLVIGALAYVATTPSGPLSRFTVLPIQIFNWTSKPQKDFHGLAAAGILLLLVVLLSMNSVAIYLRQRLHKRF
ncbi:MAG: phosphate ABC transporter permease PstA [Chloroflexota bacterium]|nr:phosphate ABC transporter permease PstA [Chloroflexota bacterium]